LEITPFAIERYFARYEFSSRYLLSSSDCEALTMGEVLAGADAESSALWERLSLGYTESPGLPLLRSEIAALYRGVDPDAVLEVVPEEGILLAMSVLLSPGDHVVATFPGYQSLYQLAADMGCEVSFWRPEESAGGWRFDLDGLRAVLRPTTRLVVVNFPHNPTGALPTEEEFAAAVDLVAQNGARLFSDEMYRFLELDPTSRLPSAVELSGHAVTLCGLSTSFSAPGLRLGWLVTHDEELRARLAVAKDYTTICAGAPSEVLGVMVLRDHERVVARNRELVKTNLAALEEFVARHRGLLSLAPPLAGSICFPRLSVAGGAASFSRRLVEEAGVMLLPGTVFDYDDAHVRVGLGRAPFREGLTVLEAWLVESALVGGTGNGVVDPV
jgi:aspartate/methionine/tyrosine aminotransferase